MGPTIRRATLDDLDTLIDLRLALMRDLGDLPDEDAATRLAAILRDYFAAELPDGRFLGWLACDDDGAAIGCGGLVYLRKPPMLANPTGREAYVMNMYTAPAWRGRGVATQILAAIVAHARESGVPRVHLHASDQGRPVYARAGFLAIGKEMVLPLGEE